MITQVSEFIIFDHQAEHFRETDQFFSICTEIEKDVDTWVIEIGH